MPGPNLVPTLEQLAQYIRRVAPDEHPLDQVAKAVELQVHLADLSDRLVGHFVNEARRASHSWAEIGEVLGVSKQAAHQRHQSRWAQYRLSEEAQLGFDAAQREAQYLRHNYVGTEHLLLGMLSESRTIVCDVLGALGLARERLRSRVAELEGEGNREVSLPPTTLTPRARKVMDLALRNAIAFGYKSVYSPHIALALLEAREGMGGELLAEASVTLETLESSLLPLMPDRREEEDKEKQKENAAAEERLTQSLAEARNQPKIPPSRMRQTLVRAREGDKTARQALVRHFAGRTAVLAIDHRPKNLARHQAVAEANGLLLRMANDPPEEDFEITLETRIRRRMKELGR